MGQRGVVRETMDTSDAERMKPINLKAEAFPEERENLKHITKMGTRPQRDARQHS